MSIENIYSSAMVNLATHHVKNALVFLVLYIHKTGSDLSKEILDLSHNPASLEINMRVARTLEENETSRVNLKFDEDNQDSSKMSSEPRKSSSKQIDEMRSKVIHEMNKRSLTGINLVLVDKAHNVFRYHYNELSSIPQADLGLDMIKYDLMLKANGSSHNISGFGSPDDNRPQTPNNPNGDYGNPNLSDLTNVLDNIFY